MAKDKRKDGNISNHQRNSNKNHMALSPHTYYNDQYLKKKEKKRTSWKGCEGPHVQ